ncbi:KUP/HAK/KT family potassium transporter [Sphingobacterium psychroaquaticum]|uniref:Probable potassium transport system protein Kup n=1 Tax=Sphingobacterium psychroaquaticum TaxID=561061 RepID=A0A1X7J2I9_9SPHI|nr:KUP/HAK/KT family potassium transporter [Sphingobacterium psychroaquaticum]QBQ40140.1 potassium transporter Kup [Sphingobacterium psychroaquaticum]SMG21792.1 KUP system potassium uptake protein [Sphingobacterium psychroaquaticum]
MKPTKHDDVHKLSLAGLLISLGIVFGDIGTSPLYVFKAVFHQGTIDRDLIIGSLSCVFWTLTLQTTVKYVWITLNADNKGEGGILSLYSLVRKKAKWLIIPAIIGASALLADGMITPAITISSAIEGIAIHNPTVPTVPIVVVIISLLFLIQRFGTSIVGRVFGPLMLIWFTTIATLGAMYVHHSPEVLYALNPYYAIKTIVNHPQALILIGAIFLCTTGAEALYSDMGHCGKKNIRISWIFVKIALVLNYLGQGAWLLEHQGSVLGDRNPFYAIMPDGFIVYGIAIATMAAVIASQAMISGSYTLISEAVRLNIWPKVAIRYPSDQKGQLYVPSINLILYLGCMLVIAVFKDSSKMDAAYGLAINLTFLTTTILMCFFLARVHVHKIWIALFGTFYFVIEFGFLFGNLSKIHHGGWLTLLLAAVLFTAMFSWYGARKIKNRFVKFNDIRNYYPIISELTEDKSVPLYASHLVYLTSANKKNEIESKIIYSIINKKPKRADVYWLVHVDVMDNPHTRDYVVDQLIPNKLIRVDFKLGFREEQRISLLFRKVVEDMVQKGEIDITSNYETLKKHKIAGDFNFVVLEKIISKTHDLKWHEKIILEIYKLLKRFSLSEEKGFGLDSSFVTLERVPLNIPTTTDVKLTRLTK